MIITKYKLATTSFQKEEKILVSVYKGKVNFNKAENWLKANV